MTVYVLLKLSVTFSFSCRRKTVPGPLVGWGRMVFLVVHVDPPDSSPGRLGRDTGSGVRVVDPWTPSGTR